MAAEDCSKVAIEAGLKKVKVYVKGPGNGRESASDYTMVELK
jgi:small subunit ribosomal protein S11